MKVLDQKSTPYDTYYDYNNYEKQIFKQPKAIIKLLYKLIGDKPKEILSIGCGNGYVERPLLLSHHTVHGFELSEHAVELSKKNGIDCRVCDITSLNVKEYQKYYDWIIAIDLWEHIIESDIFLNNAYSLLKSNGNLFLKAPNFGHMWFRLKYLIYGSLNTIYQLNVGHYAHYNYSETLAKIHQSSFNICGKYFFSYPLPFTIKARRWMIPNATSVSTILHLTKGSN